MILKIFFFGVLATLPAIFFEIAFFEGLTKLNLSPFLIYIFNIFLGVALVEEFLKFLIVKGEVLNNPEFDEPVDAMIYMIIAALGFAAGENILILFPIKAAFFIQILRKILEVSVLRFLGATLLHALSSAIVGLFIGLSLRPRRKVWPIIFFGLFLAILLHGLYNFSIMEMGGNLRISIPYFLLLSSAIFVSFGFKKLKTL